MAKVVSTFKSVEELDAKATRAIAKATRAIAGLEPSNVRIVAAVRAVQTLTGQGFSVRAIAYYTGAPKTTAERLASVAKAITGDDWPDVGDSADAITGALYTVHALGGARAVTEAVELAKRATNGDDAYAAVTAHRDSIRAAERAALSAPANRPGAVTPGGKAKAEDVDADAGESVSTSKTASAADVAANLPARALVAEVVARLASGGIRGDLIEDLASAVEAAMTTSTVDA